MKKIYSTLLTVLIASAAMAQVPTLVLDINDGTSGSNPRDMRVFNNQLFLVADDGSGVNSGGTDTGLEPWVSDGTASGTSIVADINPGDGNSSSPFNAFEFMGELYFTANDGAAELWKTDLTAAGTVKVDLFPNVTGDVPNNAKVFGNTVYLTTDQPDGNSQLTEWDGTNPAQIAPDAAGNGSITTVSEITTYNNLLYLYMENTVDEAAFGRELYSYDPATDIFTLIKDIAAGNANSGISEFTVVNGILYFEALGELWQTDGTEAGTVEVPASATLSMGGVSSLHIFNDNLLFEGDLGSRDQLFLLNTTTGAITQLSTNSGTTSADDFNPSDYATVGNEVYFSGSPNGSSLKYLYRTDGVGVNMIDDTIKDVDDVTLLNGLLYFEGEDLNASLGNELYVFNPATASISAVNLLDIKMYPNPSNNGLVNFSGNLDVGATFSINDLSGRKVLEGNLQNNTLQHNLSTGIYFIEIENIENSFKLIVE